MSTSVGILGGTGYTGTQLVSILLNHSDAEIRWITSEKFKGKIFSESFPYLKNKIDTVCRSVAEAAELENVELVFSCLPALTSMEFVEKMIDKGSSVIDLSSDFRLGDPGAFKNFFKSPHNRPDLLKKTVYGLPELNREKIKNATLVANPGCFSTSAVLPLVPLIGKVVSTREKIIIDIKAPISGAGRAPRQAFHHSEVNQNITFDSYYENFQKIEIADFFSSHYEFKIDPVFMIHRAPVKRGISTSIYLQLNKNLKGSDIKKLYDDYYGNEEFIRIRNSGDTVQVKNVTGSNICDITFGFQENTLIVESVLDNLIKGASGQAVQNMNLMFGMEESTGLDLLPVYP